MVKKDYQKSAGVVSLAHFDTVLTRSLTRSVITVFSIFLLERNPLQRSDCSRNPCSDTRVCSIPNGQKQHFSVLNLKYLCTPVTHPW